VIPFYFFLVMLFELWKKLFSSRVEHCLNQFIQLTVRSSCKILFVNYQSQLQSIFNNLFITIRSASPRNRHSFSETRYILPMQFNLLQFNNPPISTSVAFCFIDATAYYRIVPVLNFCQNYHNVNKTNKLKIF